MDLHGATREDLQEDRELMPQKRREKDVESDQAARVDTPAKRVRATDIDTNADQAVVQSGVFYVVAGVLTLWDFSPISPKEWQIPQSTTSSPVGRPMTDIRVMIAQRDLLG